MDIVFTGQYEAAVEEGRITLPSAMRAAMPQDTGSLWVFCGIFPCLFLVTEDTWNKLSEPYQNVPLDDTRGMLVQQRIGTAKRVNIDRMGRMVIPQHLWDWAGISEKCWVRGCLRRVELWAPERLREHEANLLSVPSLLDVLRVSERSPAAVQQE